MTTFELEKGIKEKLYRAFASGIITAGEMENLPVRLGCLALNFIDAEQEKGAELQQAVVWLLFRRTEAPLWLRYRKPELIHPNLPTLQITPDQQALAERLLKLAVEFGYLLVEDGGLTFPNKENQNYFCAVYCMSYPIDNDILYRTIPQTWYVWSDLDLYLPEKAWQFIKEGNEDGEYEASSLLMMIGESTLREDRWVWWEIIKEQIVTLLIGGLSDQNSFVRGQAASILSDSLNPRNIEPLLGLIHDPNPDVRANVAIGLGTLEEKRAIPGLIELLDDEDGYVRQRAVFGLSYIGDPVAVGPLIDTLQNDEEAEYAAAMVLGQFKDLRAVQPLIEALNYDYNQTRMYAAQSLGELSDKRAIEPLAHLLNDEEEDVRFMAAYALGLLGDRRSFEFLIEQLNYSPEIPDKRTTLKWRAAKALGESGDIRAVKHLLTALPKSTYKSKEEIITALGKLGDPVAIEPLIRLLGDSSGSVRVEAVRALGQLAAETALPKLEELALNDEGENWDEVTVKEVAAGAIEQIQRSIEQKKKFPNLSIKPGIIS